MNKIIGQEGAGGYESGKNEAMEKRMRPFSGFLPDLHDQLTSYHECLIGDPMNSIDEIIQTIAETKDQLRSEFGVIGIGIFGSVVRGEHDADSDVDILVELERPMSAWGRWLVLKHISEEENLHNQPMSPIRRIGCSPRIDPTRNTISVKDKMISTVLTCIRHAYGGWK